MVLCCENDVQYLLNNYILYIKFCHFNDIEVMLIGKNKIYQH